MILRNWTLPDRGALFIVTGASGTGKTTLVKKALTLIPGIQFSVSVTTRAMRRGEQDGVDYHFFSKEGFQKAVDEDKFLEWAEVYGNYYGTLTEQVESALNHGESILLEIDSQGAEQIRQKLPDAVSIFILPPSIETIESRLRGRKTDSEEIIQRRINEARIQLRSCGSFEYLVVNDDLESAHNQFQAILISELLKRKRRNTWVQQYAE